MDLDGTRDGGEPALEGWVAYLDTNQSGTRDDGEPSATTDGTGRYVIDGLAAGTHRVAEVVPSGWKQTWPGEPDEAHTVTLTADQPSVEADFGNAQAAVYGWVWDDANLNQAWDMGESPLPGWTVYLDNNQNGELDDDEPNTRTDGNGYYVFSGLSAETTYVVAELLPAGWRQTWPGAPDYVHLVSTGTGALWTEAAFGNTQNVRPTADAGGPYSAEQATTITLDGSASSDADGTIVLYEWDVNNDGLYEAMGVTTTFTATVTGTATVGLRVTDNRGAQDTDTAIVEVLEAIPPEPPVVTITATDADAGETGPDTGSLKITRTGSAAASLTVQLSIDGSATEGDDFWNLPRTVLLAAGESSVVLTVTPVDDGVTESEETVTVTIEADAGYTVGDPKAATVTIADNDLHPFQNPVIPTDVNRDGRTTPLDALIIINAINAGSFGTLPPERELGQPYLDVNGDNAVTPGDVLDVINFINGQAAAEGEGESPGEPQTNAAASVVPELEFASDASSRPGTSDSRPGDSESAADVIGSRPGGLRTPAIPQRAAISPVRPLYRYRAADRGVESDRNLEDWEDLLTEIAAFQVSSFLAGAF